MMKKIACAALALTLLGTTAAEARGWGHGGGWGHHGGWHGAGWGVLGVGLGLLTLGAIASEHDHYRDRDAYERGRYDQERDDYYRDRDNRDDDRGPPPSDRHYHDDDGY